MWKEGRGPRRSSSFSGVVGGFPGLSRTTFKGPGEDGKEEEENSVEEEESDVTEGVHAPQMTQTMANIQEASRPQAFEISSMKEPECFDGTQPFKVRIFIQSFQLIFHNYLANFSQERKKVLNATSLLIGRAEKWRDPYLSNLTNQDPNYLLN
ncbi:hypothetical protein O181_012552 [Austropuccinia psidii MF-1]|uniref:DUF4939 domain-containing protein n=1 Tax=Austropuccinia psidii MF-1 TaxID=1389203 RepID=A0A9Q3BWN3_9BASI|nr:hypothetical protein [Austropuccinia psidii MF-1]